MSGADLWTALGLVGLSGAAACLLARLGLAWVKTRLVLPAAERRGASALGAGLVASALLLSGGIPQRADTAGLLGAFALCLTGALLLVLAACDRRTGWGPDPLVLPLCLAAWPAGVWLAGGVPAAPDLLKGLALFGTAQIPWALRLPGADAVPAPDLVALMMPVTLFGLSPAGAAAMVAPCALLALCLRSERVRRIFCDPAVVADIRADAGDRVGLDRPHVTYLAVAGPLLVIIVAIFLLVRV